MKTRRSVRNQDRLFKALFKPEKKDPMPIKSSLCWNCTNYPKQGRNRGYCTLSGEVVLGRSEDRKCFRLRKGTK